MCGPADYDALRMSVSRLLELSGFTLAFFAVRALARTLAQARSERSPRSPAHRKPGSVDAPARLESRG